MSGPEHYKEAERLLSPGEYDEAEDRDLFMRDVALAQVHATLALAAATALPGELHTEWLAATKPSKAAGR